MAGSAFPPSVVIVGAQKAATTGLMQSLGTHPDVIGLRTQEAGMLHDDPDSWDHWLTRYNPEVQTQAGLIVAKLATAMYFPDTLENIQRLNSEVKLVVALRHPVERMLSLHRYALQHGLETRPVEVALADDCVQHAQQRWRLHSYSGGSAYADSLAVINERFPREQVFYLAHEDVGKRLGDVARFMGVDPERMRLVRANESRASRSALLARVLGSQAARGMARTLVPPKSRASVKAWAESLNSRDGAAAFASLPGAARARYLERHERDVRAAETVLGRSLPGWRS